MSDTPTLANLILQWSAGDASARRAVYAHLRSRPDEAAAAEAFVRDDLRAPLPWRRVLAAEAVLDLYADEPAAAAALAWVLAGGEPTACAAALGVVERLSPATAARLLAGFALHAPDAFAALTPDWHRRAGAALAADPGEFLKVIDHAAPRAQSDLLLGLADVATRTHTDLAPLVPALKARLFEDGPGYAAGAALWRVTWRVHRDWLASINPHTPRFDGDTALLVLLTEVLSEHLGRRPDLAPLVRDLLVRVATDAPAKLAAVLDRLVRLGGRGWAVLLPLLDDPAAPSVARWLAFARAVQRPALTRLTHHRAHRVVLQRAADGESVPPHLLGAAAEVLAALGPDAGSALPDLLDLLAAQPETESALGPALAKVAPGHPTPGAAVARTLDRLRRSVVFPPEAFAALAQVYAGLNFDGAPQLIDDTALSAQTVRCLLDEEPWKAAPPDVRRRHARAVADRLGSPRAEVRARAAAALGAYPDQLGAVWPALVAVLLGNDDHAARLLLPLFGHLEPVAGAVEGELTGVLAEPDPGRAARAAVALLHLGGTASETGALCRAVLTDTTGAWGWAVPPEATDGVVRGAAARRPLAAPVERVTERVLDLLFAEEAPEEASLAAHIPTGGAPLVEWRGVERCVSTDPDGPFLLLALMCAFGSRGFVQKIELIKHQRGLANTGLREAKDIVERVIDVFGRAAPPDEKRDALRAYFGIGRTLPVSVTELLGRRFAWHRWAGLELLDAWGVPDQLPDLVGARLRDRSELVRRRARRMPYC